MGGTPLDSGAVLRRMIRSFGPSLEITFSMKRARHYGMGTLEVDDTGS